MSRWRLHRLAPLWPLLGAVGVLVADPLLYVPAVARVASARRTLKQLGADIRQAREMAQHIPQEEAALQQDHARYRLLERRLGTEQSVARILEALGAQAREHRLELVAQQPRADDEEQQTISFGSDLTLREVPLTLQLSGRYRHVGEFLGRLADQPFVASVKSLTMTKPETTRAQLSANLVLVIYLVDRNRPVGAS